MHINCAPSCLQRGGKWKQLGETRAKETMSKIAGPLERDRRPSNSFHAAANGRPFAAIGWQEKQAETDEKTTDRDGNNKQG